MSTQLTATSRRSSRQRGKSDQIDALNVARAASRPGSRPADGRAGRPRARHPAARRSSRTAGPSRVALNSTLQWNLHDLWPELTLPGGALFSKKWTARSPCAWPAPSRRCAASGSRATSCAGCASSPSRSSPQERDHRARRSDRAAAPHRARLRATDRSKARRRDRRRSALLEATPSSHEPPASRRSQQAQDTRTASASTAAATARSTPRSTASPSPARAASQRRRTTSLARRPKARAPAMRSDLVPRDTSPATSGTSSKRPTRHRQSASQHLILDTGAANGGTAAVGRKRTPSAS